MSTLYVFVIIVTLSTHCSGYVVSHSETDRSIASVILKEGQSAEISCMTKGTGDYFWRKGETLYNSTLVASFTVGEVSDDSQPYSVTENGTLQIKSVTLKDEGNYFCRLSSTENECYGEVKILVQASLFNFDLAIDRCDRESSCLLYLDPSQSTSLTCTALNAPPLMALKWFNGSKEITEGIVENELIPQNGNSREITSTVTTVYGRPASFTCQAVDPKRGSDDIRFAHAQVEMTVPFIETLPSWITVSVTLVGCFIVFAIFLLIKAKVNRKQRKKYTKLKKEDVESLTKEVKNNETAINLKHLELTEAKVLADAKDREISELKTKAKTNEEAINAKNQELTKFKVSAESKESELKDKLRKTEEELKKSKNDNIELQTKVAKDGANIKSAGENLVSKAKSIAELEDLLKQQKVEIKQERNENVKLQKTIASAKGETVVAEELAERRNEEITKLKETVKQKDEEINSQHEKILDCQANLQKKEIALQGKSVEISDLKVKLKQQEEEVNKERNANIELQTTSAIAAGETIVVKELAERRNKEISELKELAERRNTKISELKKKVEQKEKEINNQREKYSDCQTNLQKKEIDLQRKSSEISDLKLKEKDSELVEISKELTNLKEDLAKKEYAKEQKEDLAKKEHVKEQKEDLAKKEHVKEQKEDLAKKEHVKEQKSS